jgi:prepilin-type processing-associated H-X9-DG protein
MRTRLRTRAFTLAELLVVIGLISLLIGILLPALSSMQARGRDLQCQSNIRQSMHLILTYASEHGGSLPFGYYFSPSGADNEGWGPSSPASTSHLISLWSIVSNMSSRTYPLEVMQYPPQGAPSTPGFLQCPEAKLVDSKLCNFAMNPVAFICPFFDSEVGATRGGPPQMRLVERQTRLVKCLPSTAMIWDNAIIDGLTHDGSFWQSSIAAEVDDQRLGAGALHPQYRYYSDNDPFAQVPPGQYGNNKPVRLLFWPNRDGGASFGRLRFRHNRNTTCNVGYVDGHVAKFTGRFTPEGKAISHDALRKYFMVKWPSGIGIGPDPDIPH